MASLTPGPGVSPKGGYQPGTAYGAGATTNTAGTPTPTGGGGYHLSPTSPLSGPAPGTPPPDPYGTSTPSDQADQLAHPSSPNITTTPNPFQVGAYNDAKTYADSLSSRENDNITNAMQRARDAGAGASADVAAAAGRRGGAPGSGLAGVLGQRQEQQTQQQVAKTNADMTATALDKEQAARALEMGGATDIAKDQSDMFGKQADLYLGNRSQDLNTARYYSDQQNARYQRAATIAELALRYGGNPGQVLGGGGGGGLPGMGGGAPAGGGFGRTPTQMGNPVSTYSDIPSSPYPGGS